MKKVLKWVGIAFAGLILLGVVGQMMKSPEQRAADQARQAENAARTAEQQAQALAAMPTITAYQMAKDYEENTVAADQKYKGKQFKVSGTVRDISTDLMDDPYVTMGGTDEFTQPQYAFDKSAKNQLAKIKKGSKITLLCVGEGDVAKIPMSGKCQIL